MFSGTFSPQLSSVITIYWWSTKLSMPSKMPQIQPPSKRCAESCVETYYWTSRKSSINKNNIFLQVLLTKVKVGDRNDRVKGQIGSVCSVETLTKTLEGLQLCSRLGEAFSYDIKIRGINRIKEGQLLFGPWSKVSIPIDKNYSTAAQKIKSSSYFMSNYFTDCRPSQPITLVQGVRRTLICPTLPTLEVLWW